MTTPNANAHNKQAWRAHAPSGTVFVRDDESEHTGTYLQRVPEGAWAL